MIATAKPDCLQVMVPPDFTARLAKQASGAGLSTVEMAFGLLSESLNALENGTARPAKPRPRKPAAE